MTDEINFDMLYFPVNGRGEIVDVWRPTLNRDTAESRARIYGGYAIGVAVQFVYDGTSPTEETPR
jgi:hypothetical protein